MKRCRIWLVPALLLVLSACSNSPARQPQHYPQPIFAASRILPDNYELAPVYDPWQPLNSRIYNFNYQFDNAVFIPVVRGYRTVVPRFARKGIYNFYRNLGDITTMVNSLLQLNMEKFFTSTGRVFANSTLGLLGLVDVASAMEIPRPVEDFGQTLGHWGVPKGPYLVLPLLGPSNLRDGVALAPDLFLEYTAQGAVLSDPLRSATTFVEAVDTREDNAFRYYETGFTFEYRMLRWLYSTKRDLDVLK